MFVFFFKQKTAYELRISDWSSDVCSSDLAVDLPFREGKPSRSRPPGSLVASVHRSLSFSTSFALVGKRSSPLLSSSRTATSPAAMIGDELIVLTEECERRSAEHTSELQSLMRISSAVFCLTTTNIHTQ